MTTTTTRRPVTLDERKASAELRAAGAATQGYRMQRDAGGAHCAAPEGTARMVGFPATIRAKKVTYNDQELVHLQGVASVYDVRYEMWDMFGPYEEIVDAHAGDETLASDPDVSYLVNHKGLTMARTVNPMPGKLPTLLLANVDVPEYATTGLGNDAYVNPKRHDIADLVTAVDDGLITEMSFAFMIEEGWWSDDWMTYKITKFDIHRGDVSAVNYGANPYTSVAARQQEILRDVARMPAGAARAALRELMGRSDVGIDVLYRAYAAGAAQDRALSVAAAEARIGGGPSEARGRSLTLVEAMLAEDGEF